MVVNSIPGRRLVLGWVTVFGRACHLWHATSVCNQPPRPTQPPTLCGTRNEYRSECCDALRLGVEGRMAHSIVDKRVGGR